MKHKFASDCHTHSTGSPDGVNSPQEMAQRAQQLGLYAYTLTDHCECQEYWQKYQKRTRAAWQAMEPLKAGPVKLLRGMELGQPLQNLPGAEEAVEQFPYDYIIGSLHNLAGEEDFYYMDCSKMDAAQIDERLEAYWDQLLEMIDWGRFDALGHLTYPLRYIQGEQGVPVDLDRHREKTDQVLRALIKKGVALEVNTSGLRQKLGETLPGLKLLKRYRDLGGRLLTLGSDAHSTETLGTGIDQGMELLKAAGFAEFAVYVQRKPVLLPLE